MMSHNRDQLKLRITPLSTEVSSQSFMNTCNENETLLSNDPVHCKLNSTVVDNKPLDTSAVEHLSYGRVPFRGTTKLSPTKSK